MVATGMYPNLETPRNEAQLEKGQGRVPLQGQRPGYPKAMTTGN